MSGNKRRISMKKELKTPQEYEFHIKELNDMFDEAMRQVSQSLKIIEEQNKLLDRWKYYFSKCECSEKYKNNLPSEQKECKN